MSGFPIISEFNSRRHRYHEISHSNMPIQPKVITWIAHKALTAVMIPANILAATAGCAGMVATAATLGAVKVAIFAASLGNIKPKFSTGFIWLGVRTLSSLLAIAINVGEIVQDGAVILDKSYRAIKWAANAIGISNFVETIFKELSRMCRLFVNRMEASCELVMSDEPKLPRDFGTIPYLQTMADHTSRLSWFNDKNRSIATCFKHKAYSIVNIPLNAAVACVSGTAFVGAAALTMSKIMLHLFTNIHIPLPVGTHHLGFYTLTSSGNTVRNINEVVVDGVVAIYRISEVTGLVKVAKTVAKIVAYIPRAVVS